LDDREDNDIQIAAVSGYGDHVEGIKHSRKDGQAVPPAHAEGAGDADEADADEADKGGRQVVGIRLGLVHGPVHEGDDDAVGGCKEGILSRGGSLQAVGLEKIAQEQGKADDETGADVGLVDFLQPFVKDNGQ